MTTKDERTGEEITREKVAVKFRYANNQEPEGEPAYFISGSPSLKDRATKAQSCMPFIATIVERETDRGRKKYYAIE